MSWHHPILHIHLSKKKRKNLLDKVVMVAAFMYPLCGLPQVWTVLNGSATGVSLVSWTGFLMFAGLFFAYGITHNIKPMIITNAVWLVVDSSVVVGTIVHRIGG